MFLGKTTWISLSAINRCLNALLLAGLATLCAQNVTLEDNACSWAIRAIWKANPTAQNIKSI